MPPRRLGSRLEEPALLDRSHARPSSGSRSRFGEQPRFRFLAPLEDGDIVAYLRDTAGLHAGERLARVHGEPARLARRAYVRLERLRDRLNLKRASSEVYDAKVLAEPAAHVGDRPVFFSIQLRHLLRREHGFQHQAHQLAMRLGGDLEYELGVAEFSLRQRNELHALLGAYQGGD
jgi:hypothetical protein